MGRLRRGRTGPPGGSTARVSPVPRPRVRNRPGLVKAGKTRDLRYGENSFLVTVQPPESGDPSGLLTLEETESLDPVRVRLKKTNPGSGREDKMKARLQSKTPFGMPKQRFFYSQSDIKGFPYRGARP